MNGIKRFQQIHGNEKKDFDANLIFCYDKFLITIDDEKITYTEYLNLYYSSLENKNSYSCQAPFLSKHKFKSMLANNRGILLLTTKNQLFYILYEVKNFKLIVKSEPKFVKDNIKEIHHFNIKTSFWKGFIVVCNDGNMLKLDEYGKFECIYFSINFKKIQNIKVKQLSTGENHFILLLNDKNLYAYGCNKYGQLGLGDLFLRINYVSNITKVENFSEDIKNIACGGNHNIILTEKNEIFGWGSIEFGQLGDENLSLKSNENDYITRINTPQKIKTINNVSSIYCGKNHTIVVLVSREIYGFGSNDQKQINDSKFSYYKKPTIMKNYNRENYIPVLYSICDITIMRTIDKEKLHIYWILSFFFPKDIIQSFLMNDDFNKNLQ